MIWKWAFENHEFAIHGLILWWLRLSGLGKFLWFSLLGGLPGSGLALTIAYHERELAYLGLSLIPWAIFFVESMVESDEISAERYSSGANGRHDWVTRAEYIGGFGQLPHGRFVYLILNGSRENPTLTLKLSKETSFSIPLLDLDEASEKRERDSGSLSEALGQIALATLTQRSGGMFGGEHLTMNVKFKDIAGRVQVIELRNFWHGDGEVRTWRNYIVCARFEGDTGIQPFGPWPSLPPEPGGNGQPPESGTAEPVLERLLQELTRLGVEGPQPSSMADGETSPAPRRSQVAQPRRRNNSAFERR